MKKRLSIAETAEYLGISTKTVRRYIASGRLKAHRLGPRVIRIDVESIEALLQPIGNWESGGSVG
ncbi:helix-turn-helix domain-containing protein [Gordonia jacobaea]|uniref:helix-turn-helix domain-containing protein n=1 Tax=Gordonia jacobaea TaxID=122202 RepID=UPI003D72FB7A